MLLYQEKKSIFRRNIPGILAISFLVIISTGVVIIVRHISSDVSSDVPIINFTGKEKDLPEPADPAWKFKPGPISMDMMKKKGCVADGFLSEYGDDTKNMVKLINRSECAYLHRALETWANPPDFKEAEEIMERVKKEPIIYGMFIAEAIRTNVEYSYPEKDRDFRFSLMCKDGTENYWGESICVPTLEKNEYKRYVQYITRRAMDIGIQSFLFGQVFLQDNPDLKKSEIPEIAAEMRKYAAGKGMQIVIGAQTNEITDEKYLDNFDFIDGGVGINGEGNIESGPCLSRKSSCWALLWNKKYSSRAKNVFLHLDWSGLLYDDMSVFARMDHEIRVKTLKNLYQYFTSRDMGFLMPFLAVINRDNDGCHGPSKQFYSPDNKYSCDDENDIYRIMRGEY